MNYFDQNYCPKCNRLLNLRFGGANFLDERLGLLVTMYFPILCCSCGRNFYPPQHQKALANRFDQAELRLENNDPEICPKMGCNSALEKKLGITTLIRGNKKEIRFVDSHYCPNCDQYHSLRQDRIKATREMRKKVLRLV